MRTFEMLPENDWSRINIAKCFRKNTAMHRQAYDWQNMQSDAVNSIPDGAPALALREVPILQEGLSQIFEGDRSPV